jgi:hypothetical protein
LRQAAGSRKTARKNDKVPRRNARFVEIVRAVLLGCFRTVHFTQPDSIAIWLRAHEKWAETRENQMNSRVFGQLLTRFKAKTD